MTVILNKCVCLVAQLCLTLCDPWDYSPPGSSVHEILQARILEWVAISPPEDPSRSQWRGLFCVKKAKTDNLGKLLNFLSLSFLIYKTEVLVCISQGYQNQR